MFPAQKEEKALLRFARNFQTLIQFYNACKNVSHHKNDYFSKGISKEEIQFDKALKKNPVPEYVNDTVSTVSNDLKKLLIGNNFNPIDAEKIEIKVNIKTNCDSEEKVEEEQELDQEMDLGEDDDYFDQTDETEELPSASASASA